MKVCLCTGSTVVGMKVPPFLLWYSFSLQWCNCHQNNSTWFSVLSQIRSPAARFRRLTLYCFALVFEQINLFPFIGQYLRLSPFERYPSFWLSLDEYAWANFKVKQVKKEYEILRTRWLKRSSSLLTWFLFFFSTVPIQVSLPLEWIHPAAPACAVSPGSRPLPEVDAAQERLACPTRSPEPLPAREHAALGPLQQRHRHPCLYQSQRHERPLHHLLFRCMRRANLCLWPLRQLLLPWCIAWTRPELALL